MADSSAKKPIQSAFPVKSVSLNLIDLDLKNSRFPRDAQSQTDAFELMFSTAGNDCLDMLRDLTRTGRMNSSDLPIAVERDGRYIMMEGNRRLACLRLWADPGLLHQYTALDMQYSSRVERLVEDSDYKPPTELRITVAPSEAEADVWIERKHAGGAGGAGTVEWGSAMKDRRRARNNPAKASRAMAFVELVSSEYADEPDVLLALETVRRDRYSFIQRFVNRSVVRERIGLDYSNGKMTFRSGPIASLPIIRQVLTDFARPKAESGKTWARELDTVKDFQRYLDKHSHLLSNKETSGGFISTDEDRGGTSASGPVGARTAGEEGTHTGVIHSEDRRQNISSKDADAKSRPPRPEPPRQYIFRDVVLDKFTPRIQEMARQTSLLSVSRHNETVSVMLRVILDLAAYQFLLSHGKNHGPRDLDKRIKEAIKIIDPHASDALSTAEATSPLRKAFHNTTPESIRLTQYAVHDIHSGRTPAEVLTLADRYAPVLAAMNDNMGDKSVK